MRLAVLLSAAVTAQFLPLKSVQPPGSHALATVAPFFIYSAGSSASSSRNSSKSNNSTTPRLPAFGWGLWDKKYALPAKIVSHDMSYTLSSDSNLSDDGYLDMAVMDYDSFWSTFVPYQQENHFCCTKADVAQGDCENEHDILLPPTLREDIFITKVPIRTTLKAVHDVASAEFRIERTGIYFLMFVNCGAELPPGRMTGAVIAHGAHGLLSGMDVPKLQLYAGLSIGYAALALFWGIWCLKYRRQMIVLHHHISAVIALGLFEQLAWLVHLSWANVVSPPSDLLLIVAITASVFKNVATCLLILLASFGYCITRPTLDASTVAKLWVGAIALGILDATRQLAMHFHVSLDLSMLILLLCALPITLLYAGGLAWAFNSLNSLIEELKVRRQTAKLRQMSRFRGVLITAAILFAVSTFIEAYVLSLDIRQVWTYEWIFTDAVPNSLFGCILIVTATLWRPTRSSKFYSYNLQLPDHEIGDSTLDIDRIRADIHGKAFEVTFDSPSTTGLTEHRAAEIRAWGEIDLDMEEDEEAQPVAERAATKG